MKSGDMDSFLTGRYWHFFQPKHDSMWKKCKYISFVKNKRKLMSVETECSNFQLSF